MLVWALAIAATVIASALALEWRRRRRAQQRLAIIEQFVDPALAQLPSDDLVAELLKRAGRSCAADVVLIAIADEVTRRLAISRSVGIPAAAAAAAPASLPIDASLLGRAMVTGRAEVIDDVREVHIAHDFIKQHVRAAVVCPLVTGGRRIGVLLVGRRETKSFNSRDDLAVIRLVADRLAGAVERSRLSESSRTSRLALADRETHLRTLLDAAPIGVVELDPDGTILQWNRSAGRLLRLPENDAERQRIALRNLGPLLRPLAVRAAQGETVLDADVTLEPDGAPPRTLAISTAALQDADGRATAVLALVDDVTERRALDLHFRQAQRMEALGRLAGAVAHDFNNLLTIVVGYSQFLLRRLDPDDPNREDIEAIGRAGARAADLTHRLLAIGRRQPVRPEPLDLQATVTDLEGVLARVTGDEVELRVVAVPGAANVRVDPGELEQVILNLVINARDAMDEPASSRAKRVVVECREIELTGPAADAAGVPSGRYVLLTIADTGEGMSPEVREHCFEPFFTTKPRGKGTGLGLAAVYSVVTQAGGAISVTSEVGRGTAFHLYFPAEEAEAPPKKPARRRRRKAGPGRVLLVEDEDAIRTLTRSVLEEEGHTVVEAASAELALVLADGMEQPDLLLTDVVLPGLRGDELAAHLLERWPTLRVLLVSGQAEAAEHLEASAENFLTKPFTLDDLIDKVDQLLPPRRRTTARSDTRRRARS